MTEILVIYIIFCIFCKFHCKIFSDVDLPDEVIYFLRYFKEMIEEQSVTEILGLYEHGFPELTEKFFCEKMWPEDKIVEKVVGTGLI